MNYLPTNDLVKIIIEAKAVGEVTLATRNATTGRIEFTETGKQVLTLTEERIIEHNQHEYDGLFALFKAAAMAIEDNAAGIKPAALRKTCIDAVSNIRGWNGEGEHYIFADVYGQLLGMIDPHTKDGPPTLADNLSDTPFIFQELPKSIVESVEMLIEHWQKTKHLTSYTQLQEAADGTHIWAAPAGSLAQVDFGAHEVRAEADKVAPKPENEQVVNRMWLDDRNPFTGMRSDENKF